jgi:hypothetical protein
MGRDAPHREPRRMSGRDAAGPFTLRGLRFAPAPQDDGDGQCALCAGRHRSASSRLASPELCFISPPPPSEGAGKTGCRLAPAVHCAKVALQNGHSGIQVKPNNRPSLRSGLTAYAEFSPGSDALLPPSPCGWLMRAPGRAAHITTRLGAQTPGARTTRFCRTRTAPVVCATLFAHGVPPCEAFRADAVQRPPRLIPRFVTIAIRPSDWDEVALEYEKTEFR